MWLAEPQTQNSWDSCYYPYTLERHSSLLVECVETLGEKANGDFSKLKITDVEDLYIIEDYDGLESVVVPDTIKWRSAISDSEVRDLS